MSSPSQQQQNWGLPFALSPVNSYSSLVEDSPVNRPPSHVEASPVNSPSSPINSGSSQDSPIFFRFALAAVRRHLTRNDVDLSDDTIRHRMDEVEAWGYDYDEFNELLLSCENSKIKSIYKNKNFFEINCSILINMIYYFSYL